MGLFWKRRPHLHAQRGRAGAVVGALSATCRCDTVANRLHQRPCHIHPHRRQPRGAGDSTGVRGLQGSSHFYQESDRARNVDGRCKRVDLFDADDENGFIAGNINFEHPDEDTACLNIIPQTREAHFDMFLSNSFGFGGTNSTLIVKTYNKHDKTNSYDT